jgi:hypothetical protein
MKALISFAIAIFMAGCEVEPDDNVEIASELGETWLATYYFIAPLPREDAHTDLASLTNPNFGVYFDEACLFPIAFNTVDQVSQITSPSPQSNAEADAVLVSEYTFLRLTSSLGRSIAFGPDGFVRNLDGEIYRLLSIDVDTIDRVILDIGYQYGCPSYQVIHGN